ncbi:MAG TPA: deoxyribose-phosphate aldolase [Candidatus Binatia bacterium]|nr:deoxyribose-phosphate aldolase [Candidatus Binatia bacterium]
MWWDRGNDQGPRAILAALENPRRHARRAGGAQAVCRQLAARIDQTLLKPAATQEDIRQLCAEAVRWGFAAVVVNPCHVRQAAGLLAGSGVVVASVAGFPLGASLPEVKRLEAERALDDGAAEVDMVMALGALRAGETAVVEEDVRGVARACRKHGALLKVILECALLNDEEKRLGARLAVRAGADFVKTSTGFVSHLPQGGATAEDVALLRAVVGRKIGVKAAGGIRTLADAAKMLAAGASRIGTSAGVAILEEFLVLLRDSPDSC